MLRTPPKGYGRNLYAVDETDGLSKRKVGNITRRYKDFVFILKAELGYNFHF